MSSIISIGDDIDDIYTAQLELLHHPKISDLTVKCKAATWRCQSAILAQRCGFFRAIIEGDFAETRTSLIDLKDDEPQAVKALLEYLYTLRVPGTFTHERAAQILLIADKYGVVGLRIGAKKSLKKTINSLSVVDWNKKSLMEYGMAVIVKVLTLGTSDRKELMMALVEVLADAPMSLTQSKDFENILRTHSDFMLAYIATLRTALRIALQGSKDTKLRLQGSNILGKRSRETPEIDISSDLDDIP